MFSRIIRGLSLLIIGVTPFILALGAVLYRAAFVTGADSDYTVTLSWLSVLTSVIWPPTRLPFLPLLGVVTLAGFTVFTFFHTRRSIGVATLLLQAGIGYCLGGWLGWFFLPREIAHYHFNMDGEKLGENWFTYESVAVWTLAAVVLAVLRIFAGNRSTEAADDGKPTVT